MRNDQAITSAARQVAAAIARQQQAAAELTKAQGARDRIAERIAALDNQRAEIVARRHTGGGLPDDAGQIAFLDADREDLVALMADADRTVVAAQGPVQNAGHTLAAARQNLQQIEDEAAEAALIEHAARLGSLPHQTIEQLAQLRVPLGRTKPVWHPSPELWAELRRIQAAMGRL